MERPFILTLCALNIITVVEKKKKKTRRQGFLTTEDEIVIHGRKRGWINAL